MVYTGTIVTEAEMALMSGENVDSTGNTEANHNLLAYHAEDYLSAILDYDVAGNWASLTASIRRILSEWAARFCGTALISFNMGGYNSRIEAEDMININIYRMRQIEKLIVEDKTETYIKGA